MNIFYPDLKNYRNGGVIYGLKKVLHLLWNTLLFLIYAQILTFG